MLYGRSDEVKGNDHNMYRCIVFAFTHVGHTCVTHALFAHSLITPNHAACMKTNAVDIHAFKCLSLA